MSRRAAKIPAPAASSPPDVSLEAGSSNPPRNRQNPQKKAVQYPTNLDLRLAVPFCSSLRLSVWPLKPGGIVQTCAHLLAWKPAHALRRRLTHFNNITSRQTEAQFLPQSQPKVDWPRRATRSVYNTPERMMSHAWFTARIQKQTFVSTAHRDNTFETVGSDPRTSASDPSNRASGLGLGGKGPSRRPKSEKRLGAACGTGLLGIATSVMPMEVLSFWIPNL